MSSLLAILVVVNSTRGHHYLFSYPQDPKRSCSSAAAGNSSSDNNNSASHSTFVNDFTIGSSMTAKLLMQENEEQQRRLSVTSSSHSNVDVIENKTGIDQDPTLTGIHFTRADNKHHNAKEAACTTDHDRNPLKEQHRHLQNTEGGECQQQKDRFAGRDSIFNMDVSFLADTLAPKSPLCDRKFQLSIDDLTFVGHPVSLTSRSNHQENVQQPQQPQQKDCHTNDMSASLTSPLSPAQPVAMASPQVSSYYASPQLQMKTPTTPSIKENSHSSDNSNDGEDQDEEDNGADKDKWQAGNSNNSNNSKSSAEEDEDGNGAVDDGDSSDMDDDEKQNTSQSKSNNASSASTHMTLFHVVFVLSPPDLQLNSQVNTLYKHVISKYASALRYEQLRCGYVQEEVEKILVLKEEAFNKGTPYDQVMEQILHESSLAKDIKQIYNAISTKTAAHVIVNDFIDLSLQIPSTAGNLSNLFNSHNSSSYNHFYTSGDSIGGLTPYSINHHLYYSSTTGDASSNNSLMDIYSVSGYEYDQYPVMAPYHTLLLLEDPEEVLKNMPLDASPTLVQLVQILTPTQSLQELHLLLDCSLAQIYRLAAHLIYWRKAKLIHTISPRNIYVVSPTATFDAALEADFKSHIPNLSLPVILSKLSSTVNTSSHNISSSSGAGNVSATTSAATGSAGTAGPTTTTTATTSQPKPYHSVYNHNKELKNQYLEAITYLIRKDLVVQLHMYLVLLLPQELVLQQQSHATLHEQQQQQDESSSSSPNGATTTVQNLKRITYERAPKEVVELFERLVPYMNGQYHIEEIIYREGISRRQLGLVLKYYRDKIVTVYHY